MTEHPRDSLLDTAPCGFIRFRDDGVVEVANTTLCEMLGYRRDEVEGHHIDHILSRAGAVFYQTHFFPLLRLHGKADEIYLSVRDKAGEMLPVLVNAVRHLRPDDSGQESEANDCVIIPVQQRSRYEEEILIQKKAAERANQLKDETLAKLRETAKELAHAKDKAEAASRAKDDFLAALSHELRTPLTPVLMSAATLEQDATLPSDLRKDFGMMRRNIEIEAMLIDDLLDITRIGRGKLTLARTVTDIHELVDHAIEILRSDYQKKKIKIDRHFDATRTFADVDPTRIQQVFWNLLKNAVKFTPEGGHILITTRNEADGSLLVEVRDSGIGIAPEAVEEIFKPFEQGEVAGDHRYGGLGLGLAISYAIMAAHGCTIAAESEGRGCGATFTTRLATVDAPEEHPAEPKLEHAATVMPLRILVVEDHQSTRRVLAKLLGDSGHSVTTAGDLKEARAEFDGQQFDLLISDLGLPDGSGLDLMREIRSKWRIAAIALSGYGTEEDLQQIAQAGFAAHLVKPIKIDPLYRAIAEVMRQHEGRKS